MRRPAGGRPGGGARPPASRPSVAKAPAFPPGHILVGRILRAHGLRGEVSLRSYTGDPAAIAGYGPLLTPEGRTVTILRLRPAKDGFVAVLDGVADRDAAEAVSGRDLAIPRDRLPATEDEDEFFQADLLGLAVHDAEGTRLGRIVGLADFGAGDLLDLALESDGRRVYLPFTRAFVPVVDLAAGRVTIAPPEGAFDADEKDTGASAEPEPPPE